MKQILFFFLIICLASCGNSNSSQTDTTNTDTTAATALAQNTTKEEPEEEVFTELPSIAVCANEIGIYGLLYGDEAIKLSFENGEITSTSDGDVDVVVEKDRVVVEEMDGGTGGDAQFLQQYMFLEEGDNPTVLLVSSNISTSRYGSMWLEDTQEWIQTLSEKTKWDEAKITKMAELYAEREIGGFGGEFFDYETYSFTIDAFQKQDGKWTSVINNIFPSDFNQQLERFFPLFTTNKNSFSPTKTSLTFGFNHLINGKVIDANKVIFDNWMLNKGIQDDFFALTGKGFKIGTKEKILVELTWDGSKLHYSKFPSSPIHLNYYDCCRSIDFMAADFDKNKVYTFKGNLIEGEDQAKKKIPIQLEAKFKIVKPAGGNLDQPLVKMTGEYFYIGKDSKMPIEGQFSPVLGSSFIFNRMKDGQKREEFRASMTNCEMNGWWQHLERMDLYSFELKLVE